MARDNALFGFRYPAATKAKALQLAGLPLLKIEAATGASRTTIKRWLRDAGLPGPGRGQPPTRPEITTDRAIALCKEHGSASAAARTIGMHPSTMSRRANSITFV